MVGQIKTESSGQRFSGHIADLRDFFRSRSVSFGKPADLDAFAQRIGSDPSFSEELGSMVRSILYQEDERLGRGELLELVVSAVGGPGLDSTDGHLQASIRQIFLYLNAAVRQGQTPFGRQPQTESAEADEAVAVSPREAREPVRDVPAKRAPAVPEPKPEPESRPAAANGVLLRAMSLAAEAEDKPVERERVLFERSLPEPRTRGPWWAIPAAGLLVAGLGAGIYLGRPFLAQHWSSAALTAGPVPAVAGAPSSCVAPISAGVTRSGLEERSRWARNLLDQKLYDAALPELREIARLDPGYPGIKLDESDALLNLKRPEDAREAVDAQISVSECLAKLPPASLDAYCSNQFSIASVAGCRTQLTHIRQAAELQAALVHLELGHRVQPDAEAAAALAELTGEKRSSAVRSTHAGASPASLKVRHAEPFPPATEGDAARPLTPPQSVARSTGKKSNADGSLVRGEGTDSAYGAYQKPE